MDDMSNSGEIRRNLFLEGSSGYVIIFNEEVLEGKSKLLGGYYVEKLNVAIADDNERMLQALG